MDPVEVRTRGGPPSPIEGLMLVSGGGQSLQGAMGVTAGLITVGMATTGMALPLLAEGLVAVLRRIGAIGAMV